MTIHLPLGFIPPWMDKSTLSAHICMSGDGIDGWVAQGILPPPVKRGGKLMWEWRKVDELLRNGTAQASDDLVERIRNASRKAANEGRRSY